MMDKYLKNIILYISTIVKRQSTTYNDKGVMI